MRETNFTVVAVKLRVGEVYCGVATNVRASFPVQIELEPRDLPATNEVMIQVLPCPVPMLFEDAELTVPAQASYPAPRFPLTLYHRLDYAGAYTLIAQHNLSRARDRAEYTIVKVGLTPVDDYDSWMPELNNTIRFKARIEPPGFEGFFKFLLEDVSQHPGYCMNAPNPVPRSGRHSALWNDLRLVVGQPGINVSGNQDNIGDSTIKKNEQEIVISSHDYAAWGKLRCVAEIRVGPNNTVFCDALFSLTGETLAKIPRDTDDNDIADAWLHNSGSPADDLDAFPAVFGNPNMGDGLSRFQEYRGFLTADATVERTNPDKPNLFIWNKDQLPVAEFEAASKLHLVLLTYTGQDANKRVNFATGGHSAKPDYHLKKQYALTLIRIPGVNGLYDPNTLEARIGNDNSHDEIIHQVGHELGHAVNLKHHADPVGVPGEPGYEDRRYNGPICYMKYSCSTVDRFSQNPIFCACITPSHGCTNAEDMYPCWTLYHRLSTTNCLSGRCACISKIKVNPINKSNAAFPD